LLVLLLLRMPQVQTAITAKVLGYFEQEFGPKIQIGAIHFGFFDALNLQDVLISDHHQDTLIYLSEVSASFDALFSGKLELNELTLNKAQLHLKTYTNENQSNLNIFIDSFKSNKPKKRNQTIAFNLDVFELENGAVRIEKGDSLLFNVSKIFTGIEKVSFVDSKVMLHVKSFAAKDLKSGLAIKELSSQLTLSQNLLEISDFMMLSKHSKIQMNLDLVSNNIYRFDPLNPTNHINVDIEKGSFIDLKEFNSFLPEKWSKDRVELALRIEGNTKELLVDELEVKVNADELVLDFDGEILDLDSAINPYLKGVINKLHVSGAYLNAMAANANGGKRNSQLEVIQYLNLNSIIEGYYNDFTGNFELSTNLGLVDGNLNIVYDSLISNADYNGEVNFRNFNLEKISQNKDLGRVTLSANVKGSGFTAKNIRAIGKLNIKHIDYKKYNYKNIHFDGTVSSKILEGDLRIKDENIDLDFEGAINLSNKLPEFNFVADLSFVDLFALHLVKDSVAILTSQMQMDFVGSNLDNLVGNIQLNNSTYESPLDYFYMSKLDLVASRDNNTHTIDLQSDLVTAAISGVFSLADLPSAGEYLVAQYFKNYKPKSQFKAVEMVYDIQIVNAIPITKLFMPEFYVESGTRLYGNFRNNAKQLDLALRCPELTYKQQKIKSLKLNAHMRPYGFETDLSIQEYRYTEDLKVDSISLLNVLRNDTCKYKLAWDYDYNYNNSGGINGYLTISEIGRVILGLDSSTFNIADMPWHIKKGNKIELGGKYVSVNDLSIYNIDQTLSINGIASDNLKDRVNIAFKEFELNAFNEFLLSKANTQLGGLVNGALEVGNVFGKPFFEALISIDSLSINEFPMGDFSVKSKLDKVTNIIAVDGGIQSGRAKTLVVKGTIDPNNEKDQYKLKLAFDKLRIGAIQPYVKRVIAPIDGLLYGEVNVTGQVIKPDFVGELILKRSKFGVQILNTSYNIDGDAVLKVAKDKISIKSMVIRDQTNLANNYGVVTGEFNHNNFKKIKLDILVEMNNLQCLNTTKVDNDLYYGTAFGTGTYHLTGDPKNLKMDIVAKTNKGTKFFIPMESTSVIGNSDFIQFVGVNASVGNLPTYRADLSGISLNFDLDVDAQTEVDIIFDASVGDVIHARGKADLQLDISTLGQFNMFGTYVIEEGDYLFTLERLINKKFKVTKGGSILFAGDPYRAKLNLDAVYDKRISVYPLRLLSDTTNSKIPIEVHLKITDEMSSPTIKPSFELPNSSENLRSEFADRIRDESELNKQIFAVLVLNQFLPPQGLVGIDFRQGAESNASEMIFNQFSNWLSQFGDNYDLGVNYRDGNKALGESGEVEVNFSYQFFNDRLSLNGNLGVPLEQNTSNLVGDFFVEYDLTKDRRIRIKAYNRNNQYDPLLDNTSTTYGLGITYNRDFNKWNELWENAREKTKSK
jgi:hypothetical protein